MAMATAQRFDLSRDRVTLSPRIERMLEQADKARREHEAIMRACVAFRPTFDATVQSVADALSLPADDVRVGFAVTIRRVPRGEWRDWLNELSARLLQARPATGAIATVVAKHALADYWIARHGRPVADDDANEYASRPWRDAADGATSIDDVATLNAVDAVAFRLWESTQVRPSRKQRRDPARAALLARIRADSARTATRSHAVAKALIGDPLTTAERAALYEVRASFARADAAKQARTARIDRVRAHRAGLSDTARDAGRKADAERKRKARADAKASETTA